MAINIIFRNYYFRIIIINLTKCSINRLRAIWPKGYQRESVEKSHENVKYLKTGLRTRSIFTRVQPILASPSSSLSS